MNGLELSSIQVCLTDEGRLRAYINVVFNDVLMVRGFKVILKKEGLWIAMPNRESKAGEFRDQVHPLTADFRVKLEAHLLEAYEEAVRHGEASIQH